MNWIDYEYPNTCYIVEVRYSKDYDFSITTCRCKDMLKDKDNSKGFTKGFWTYEEAERFMKHVIKELR